MLAITFDHNGFRNAHRYQESLAMAHPLLIFDNDFNVSKATSDPELVLMDDISNQLKDSHRRELKLRHDSALKFWSSYIKPLDTEIVKSEEMAILAKPYGNIPQGALAFSRYSDYGRLLVLLGNVIVEVDRLGTTVKEGTPSSTKPSSAEVDLVSNFAPVAFFEVTGSDILSEISSVGSLVGMVMISANPEVGIPLMIGGAVLSWVFSRVDADKRPKLPKREDIQTAMGKVLVDQHAKELAEEATSTWSDIQIIMSTGWVEGIAPTDADLKNFMDTIKRAVDMSQVGTVHDNTNKLLDLCNAADKDGKPTGLDLIPLFTWSATVELNCWQDYVLVLMAETGAGKGKDSEKNTLYKAALISQKQRFDTLISALDELFKKSETAQDDRIKQISDLKQEIEANPPTHGVPPTIVTFSASDTGTSPPPSKDNPVVSFTGEVVYGCCGVTSDNTEEVRKQAQTALDNYKTSLRSSAATFYGMADSVKQKATLDKWKNGQTEANRLAKSK